MSATRVSNRTRIDTTEQHICNCPAFVIENYLGGFTINYCIIYIGGSAYPANKQLNSAQIALTAQHTRINNDLRACLGTECLKGSILNF